MIVYLMRKINMATHKYPVEHSAIKPANPKKERREEPTGNTPYKDDSED